MAGSKAKGNGEKATNGETVDSKETDDDIPEIVNSDDESEDSVYDSEEESIDSNVDDDENKSDDEHTVDNSDDDGFEEQGSSDEEDLVSDDENEKDEEDDEIEFLGSDDEGVDYSYAQKARSWNRGKPSKKKRTAGTNVPKPEPASESKEKEATPTDSRTNPNSKAVWLHTDDLSSDDEDEEGTQNRIGRVPLHWYDDYDHLGYNSHGTKVSKPSDTTDLLDAAISQEDGKGSGKPLTVYDALNGIHVPVNPRQLELIRRIQGGAYAHPEHDANPDLIDYFSGVNPEISGIHSNRYEPKARFQPSKYERLLVKKYLHRLNCGSVNMDFLTGKVRDMNDVIGKHGNPKKEERLSDAPRMIWAVEDEDELFLRKNRPMHIAAPKPPPPGHAESYNPSEEYLPDGEELEEWKGLENSKDRPHGLLVPKKFSSLRAVGAYEFSVRERFERCLDLYLCPRLMKRRLNIDPESLVPSLPKASDLRPFPTAQCIQYDTPYDKSSPDSKPPMIRCISASPDGQFFASGASDGYVRVWEVATGRLLKSWNIAELVGTDAVNDAASAGDANMEETKKDEECSKKKTIPPVVSMQWNPNPTHHVLLAACGNCAVLIATGTGNADDSLVTEALLSPSTMSPKQTNPKAAKAVSWHSVAIPKETPLSAYALQTGPVSVLRTPHEMTQVTFHRRGDYFSTLTPKGGAASVLIHQLSKGQSQQPFGKASKGGNVQVVKFHPNKPFLFVANLTAVRVYNLMKQNMVKRLVSGCKWISTMDVHPSGDHVIVGSLDRRMVWFDLDLSSTPYKTLKYHERAIRNAQFHPRYPLMSSCSDDGTIHIFHSTVYTDLMRNPFIVPVKVLRNGHDIVNKSTINGAGGLGVLSCEFHPTQPWLFSVGADGKIILYQDI